MKKNEISYIEVDIDVKITLRLLKKFYKKIYVVEFQDINERESIKSIIDYLSSKKKGLKKNYHIILALRNKDVLGGIIFDFF